MILAALLLAGQQAEAKPVIAAEVLQSFALGDATDLGMGIGGRIGWKLDLVALDIVPEAGITFWTNDPLLAAPELGFRTSFLKVLEPGVYAHAVFPLREGAGVGWDGGLTLDFTLIPKIDIGGQAGLMSISGGPITATAGGQISVKL